MIEKSSRGWLILIGSSTRCWYSRLVGFDISRFEMVNEDGGTKKERVEVGKDNDLDNKD